MRLLLFLRAAAAAIVYFHYFTYETGTQMSNPNMRIQTPMLRASYPKQCGTACGKL